jgi:hypothetical protein
MVIHDGDFSRPGLGPAEDEPPLIIDTDGVEPRASAPKGFETIARRNGEIRQMPGLVHL